ncbi:MAG: cytochrome c oxidase assembly protein [Candidatus Acidiferrum sp.]
MTGSLQNLFLEWDVPPAVTCVLLLTALVYMRGWVRIRETRAELFPAWRLVCFLSGVFALFAAVASPLDTFSESLLIMHMGQHFVFISVAPPLLLLGAPVVPLLRGLPSWIVRPLLGPILRTPLIRQIAKFLIQPQVAWIAMNLSFVAWHIPKAYEFALSSEFWHNIEHFCFFGTSVLFWWPVMEPWPYRPRNARWVLIPYLLLADFVNTAVSAFLCFAGRLLYPSYGEIPRLFGLSALNDQIAAGAFMWVFGSVVFLVPAIAITAQLLSGTRQSSFRPAVT